MVADHTFILGSMPLRTRLALLAVLLAGPAFAAGTRPAAQVLPRVEHHLRHIEELAHHFHEVLSAPCAHFASPADWKAYFDGEVEGVVLLMAHVEQAWIEAKETGDDDVRRAAKAPRRRVDEARALLTKLRGCAGDNGASFSQMGVWRRIEREVPERQAQIALPPPPPQ
jgi:hypothetical protein